MRRIREYHGLKFGTDIHLHVTTQPPLDIKQQTLYDIMAGYCYMPRFLPVVFHKPNKPIQMPIAMAMRIFLRSVYKHV